MGFKMDPIKEAVGFKMNNLKVFPFSRLPRNAQVEVIEEFDVKKKELVNVTSGLRGYFARNGIFGRDVDAIQIDLYKEKGENNLGIGGYCFPLHDFLNNRALFRNIYSCREFGLEGYDCQQHKADEDVKKIAKCFPNLRFVKELRVNWDPVAQKLLGSFQFKVTEFARLIYDSFTLPESRHWKHLLENHLSNCEKVAIFGNRDLLDFFNRIPEMKIDGDKEKCKEIRDAFMKLDVYDWVGSDPVKYFRRKITENKEMMMMIVIDR